MLTLTDEMKREIILDHYKSPNNKIENPSSTSDYKSIRMDSDSCIDDLTIYLKIENDIIKDAFFNGVGCAISTASTDILCDIIKGKEEKDALEIIENYHHMLHEEPYNEEVLEELNAFSNTYKQAARIKCASIGSIGIDKIIEDKKDEN